MGSGSSTIHGMYLCNCVLDEMWMKMGNRIIVAMRAGDSFLLVNCFVVELIPVVGADNLA